VTLMRTWKFLFFYGTKTGTVDDIIEGGNLYVSAPASLLLFIN
jgi:hypothetical protein